MKYMIALVLIFLSAPISSAGDLLEIPLVTNSGETTTLAKIEGKVMLIVNVASKCGYTRQYEQLQKLHERYGDKGLVVMGFPCNQFGGQEPGTNEEIAEFCQLNYGVTFPLFDKIEVNGPARHPLYDALTGEDSPFPGRIGWNFTKFLVDSEGTVLARYPSRVKPDAPEVITAIEAALEDE